MNKGRRKGIVVPYKYPRVKLIGMLNGNSTFLEKINEVSEKNADVGLPEYIPLSYKHSAVDKIRYSIFDQRDRLSMLAYPEICAKTTAERRIIDAYNKWKRDGSPREISHVKSDANDDGGDDETDVLDLIPDKAGDIDDRLAQDQLRERIYAILDNFPEKFRNEGIAMKLSLQDYSEAEISETMVIPRHKVKNLLHRFCKNPLKNLLRNELNKLGYTDHELHQILIPRSSA